MISKSAKRFGKDHVQPKRRSAMTIPRELIALLVLSRSGFPDLSAPLHKILFLQSFPGYYFFSKALAEGLEDRAEPVIGLAGRD
jgi:hypothetical protein